MFQHVYLTYQDYRCKIPAMERKKNNLLLIFVLISFSGSLSVYAQSDRGFGGSQSVITSDGQGMTIVTLDPYPMIRRQDNEDAMAAYVTGSHLMSQNRLAEAEKYLLEAVALDPQFSDALDHLGVIYRRMNRLAEAEEMYLRSIMVNSNNTVPYINLAVVYRMQGRLNDAYGLYSKLIEINPYETEGYYGIGELFYITDNYEASLHFFNIAIELYKANDSPYVYHAYYYKGMIYYMTKNYEEALIYLENIQNNNVYIDGLSKTINEIRKILFLM